MEDHEGVSDTYTGDRLVFSRYFAKLFEGNVMTYRSLLEKDREFQRNRILNEVAYEVDPTLVPKKYSQAQVYAHNKRLKGV